LRVGGVGVQQGVGQHDGAAGREDAAPVGPGEVAFDGAEGQGRGPGGDAAAEAQRRVVVGDVAVGHVDHDGADAAAAGDGDVSSDDVGGQRDRAEVVDAAAVAGHRVVRDHADVAEADVAGLVVDAAARLRGVGEEVGAIRGHVPALHEDGA